VLVLVLV